MSAEWRRTTKTVERYTAEWMRWVTSILFVVVHIAGGMLAIWTLRHAWDFRVLLETAVATRLTSSASGSMTWFLEACIALVLLLAVVAAGRALWRLLRGQAEQNVALRFRALLYVAMACLFVDVFVLSESEALTAPARIEFTLVAEMSTVFAYGVYAVWWLLLPRLQRTVPDGMRRGLDILCMNMVLLLVFAEVGLRIVAVVWPTPLLVTDSTAAEVRRAADQSPPGTVRFNFPVNQGGHYDTEFVARSERQGPLVVSIGDSFSYGIVPHAFHYTTVSERELRGIEVYNMGYPAIGPSDYLYLLEHEALPLEPDLVVVQLFVGNDVAAGPSLEGPPRWYDGDRYLVAVLWHRLQLLRRARLIDWIEVTAQMQQTRRELEAQYPWLADPFLEEPSFSEELFLEIEVQTVQKVSGSEEGLYERFFDALEEMERAAGNVPLAFVIIPDEFQVEDELWEDVLELTGSLDRDLPQRKIVGWLEDRGRPVLDLLPVLREVEPLEDGRRHLYHLQDTHFNVRGNDVAGHAMATFMRPLLPASLPVSLDVGDPSAREWMREGWHGDEGEGDDTFVWSDGQRSTLEMRLPTGADVRMDFECSPLLVPGRPSQRVSVVVNDRVIEEVTLDPGRHAYTVVLPEDALLDSPNTVEFRYAYAQAPVDVLPNSQDARVLAVAWHRIDFSSDGPQSLGYFAASSDPTVIEGGFTLAFDVRGPDDLVTAVRASNVVLSIEELRVHGEGERILGRSRDGGISANIDFTSVHVEGTSSTGPFAFDFERGRPPEIQGELGIEQIAWGLGMGGRHYTLGRRGAYAEGNQSNDAQSEAMGLIIDAPVRLPDGPVEAGDEWTIEWTGDRAQADTGGIFSYRQVARFEEVERAGARISFETTGRLDIPAPGNDGREEETSMEATGTILLDLATGRIVESETSGAITSRFGVAGFTIIRGIEASYEER